MLHNASLEMDLVACSSLFGFIPETIKRMESNSLNIHESLALLSEVKTKLMENRGSRAKSVLEKYNAVIDKNAGIFLYKFRRKSVS